MAPADLLPVNREPYGKDRPPLPDKLQRLAIREKAWLARPQIPKLDFIVGALGSRRQRPSGLIAVAVTAWSWPE